MFSFFQSKGQNIGDSSPTKNHHQKQSYNKDAIYLQQIQNYIDTQQGYDIIRNKFIIQINTNQVYDSPLVHKIISLLQERLETKERKKIQRAMNIVEDLVSYCGKVFNQAMNNRPFCEALEKIVVQPKYLTLNWNSWAEIKERICALFLYWNEKFGANEHQYFYVYIYKKLKTTDAIFPSEPFIKEVPFVEEGTKEEEQKQKKKQRGEIEQQLQEIKKIAGEGEQLLEKGKMTTEYVRVLKGRSKILYNLSTTQGEKLEAEMQEEIQRLYKRMRKILKETQKKNQQTIKERKIKSQSQYLANKIDTLQQKSTKTQIKNLLQNSEQTKQSIPKDLLDIENLKKDHHQIKNVSLFERGEQKYENTPQKNEQYLIPTKNTEKNENLLDFGEEENTINFKNLYEKAKEEEKPFGLENLNLNKKQEDEKEDEFSQYQTESKENNEII